MPRPTRKCRSKPIVAWLSFLACLFLTHCAAPRYLDTTRLSEGMSAPEVETVWGSPSNILEYQDDSGFYTRWEYHRRITREKLYWSVENQVTPFGITPTVNRRGIPYNVSYLAAFAVFKEDQLVRWQSFPPPTQPPPSIQSMPDPDFRDGASPFGLF
ncbi:MAG: hypothetical protein ACO34E_06895 [Limisphaerales bacterium]|jgi:hypothetical protein